MVSRGRRNSLAPPLAPPPALWGYPFDSDLFPPRLPPAALARVWQTPRTRACHDSTHVRAPLLSGEGGFWERNFLPQQWLGEEAE